MDEPSLVITGDRHAAAPLFISYASADRKQAMAVCEAIERRGLRCWISCRDVRPGDNYQEAIVRAIRAAPAMVLVFSGAANNSDEIKKELSLVSRYKVPVLALRIEDVEPSDAFAYELSTRQWIDSFEGWDRAIDALVRRLGEISAAPVQEAAQPQIQTGRHRAPSARPWSTRALALTALIVAALIAVAATFYLRTSREQVSIAVLPFADLSPAKDKAYFAEGIAEEILSSLAAENGIKVLGRTSVRQIEREPDPRAIRASLGVTHLLEGSTRTAGNSLRVNVRLVDTSDGRQIWEEEYSGRMGDVFDVQDRIARTVVRRLRGTLLTGTSRTAAPTSVDAYAAYLAARAALRENKREAIERAWRMSQQIVQADPSYAPGQAILAETTMLLSDGYYGYGDVPVASARRTALQHAREAIRLAPDSAEGYAAIGFALPVGESIEPYLKALALDPSRADVRQRLAIAYDILGRTDEAFEQYRLAVETEPLSPAIINRYIQILGNSGQSNEALRVIDQFVRRGGSAAQAWRFRGAVLAYRNDLSGAVAARQRALRLDPGLPYQHEWLTMYLHYLGVDDRLEPYLQGAPIWIRLFVSGDNAGLKQELVRQGPGAWQSNWFDFAVFQLGRSRDWGAVAALYDQRPREILDICRQVSALVPQIGIALAQQGRQAEATRFLSCNQRALTKQLTLRFRSPDDAPGEIEAAQASLFAVRGDPRALSWLDKAVRRGWAGQYFSGNLNDWPQFDSLRFDERYSAIQRRIDSTIARERAEVLAGR